MESWPRRSKPICGWRVEVHVFRSDVFGGMDILIQNTLGHAMTYPASLSPNVKSVRYLRKPSSLFGYVYIEVNPEHSNIGFREDQPLDKFSYCTDKTGLGNISKFRREA